MIEIKTFICNPYEENCFIINKKACKKAVIIDPGCMPGKEQERVNNYLAENNLVPQAILLTHAHRDHIHGVADLQKKYGIPVYMHPKEEPALKFESREIGDGETLELAEMKIEVITTPGHTPGGVCYLIRDEKVLFSGDTLFAGTIGRTDLPGGDYDALIVSIMDKLMGLDGDIEIFPGHARSSDIAEERTHNPFLQPFNEPEEDYL